MPFEILLGLLVLVACCFAYGVFVEPHWYRVQRYRLDILPAGSRPLSILHLSDLHFAGAEVRKRRFLASLEAPDVLVVTGDFLGEPAAVETAVEALRPVRGKLASYFVLGSNDYYVPKPLNPLRYFHRRRKRRKRETQKGRSADLIAQLEADGWVHLCNVRVETGLDGVPAEIAGLDDPHIHRDDMRNAPRHSRDSFGLAVTHAPDPAPELTALGYDLIVAGHTHGGQVRMPFVGALVNNSTLPRSISSGLMRMGPAYLHISPGLGTSKYAPFRFLCRPEATYFELSSPGAAARLAS